MKQGRPPSCRSHTGQRVFDCHGRSVITAYVSEASVLPRVTSPGHGTIRTTRSETKEQNSCRRGVTRRSGRC